MAFPISDHCDGRRFFNPGAATGKGLGDLLRWILLERAAPWPAHVPLPDVAPPPAVVEGDTCAVTFINHCTVLLRWRDVSVLTDPVYSERASPFRWTGPKRVMAPGVAFDALPKVDVVLVSHNHYDHLDAPTVRRLMRRDRPIVVTPLGNAAVLRACGDAPVVELDWWETWQNDRIAIRLTPAQHWSNRFGVARNAALWGGFWVTAGGRAIYFAADSGYGPHFRDIARRCGTPSLSLLPIGAYEPRWFMREQHMNPADAVQAHLDLASPLSVGTHFGTFRLTNEGHEAPGQALAEALVAAGVAPDRFRVPGQGETLVLR